jgi:hypothetical protein
MNKVLVRFMLKNEDRIPNRFKKNAFNEKKETIVKVHE